ncbi:MAG: threonine/serine exporter family protein, partial [Myxococcales bacterium]|nr:threonine/serine exporter family protein [Myxococcales bacterium]
VVAAELARVGGVAFGPELGAFCGAAVVGLAAEVYARRRRVPEAVLLLPGLLLLVPGSLGFQSVSLFLAEDPAAGIAAGFHMVLVAVALVAGVLVGKLAGSGLGSSGHGREGRDAAARVGLAAGARGRGGPRENR